MNNFRAALAATIFSTGAFFTLPAVAADKAEIETIVKEYLLENPEVIIEAVGKYKENQEAQAKADAKKALVENKDALFNDPDSPTINKSGKITVVEFFDYHCGYCKHLLPEIAKLQEAEPDVRIVFKEFPILSEDSRLAAQAAVAFYLLKPEKYFEYHTVLMNQKGKYSKAWLSEEAAKYGIDKETFQKKMESDEVKAELEQTRELANKLNIRGTPALVIGDEILPGAVPLDRIRETIKEQRKK